MSFVRVLSFVLWLGVSTDQQATGLDAQVRALRLFCQHQNITNYEIFSDENQSGTKASRPALDRMMAAVERGEIENVIVFAFSRFARSCSAKASVVGQSSGLIQLAQ